MNILFPAKALAAADSGGFINAADFAGAGLLGFAEAPGKADVSDLGVIFLTYERAVHITEHGAGAEAKAIKVGAGTAEDSGVCLLTTIDSLDGEYKPNAAALFPPTNRPIDFKAVKLLVMSPNSSLIRKIASFVALASSILNLE